MSFTKTRTLVTTSELNVTTCGALPFAIIGALTSEVASDVCIVTVDWPSPTVVVLVHPADIVVTSTSAAWLNVDWK